VAKEEGLLPAAFEGNKAAVKQALLAERPDGLLWETLQGLVYGRRIDAATLFEGAARFLELCREHAEAVAIVSHKTERAHHDPALTDLRVAALQWMEAKRFFDATGLGLRREHVFFEGTREQKVRRISALRCDVFIDDLAEVLGHAEMPGTCRKILFGGDSHDAFEHYVSWDEVCDAVFHIA